ncbi:MAG: phosphate/phosphite/phosphonate ABC transporter substrate-binding protein [Burkholderiales bacterium]|nr:phosphate/phosphite/phosphonate ABC transporter substrate-binding protein [Burkholderiales bacterium]
MLIEVRRRAFVLGLGSALTLRARAGDEASPTTLAVVPQLTPILAFRRWSPLTARLESGSGQRLKLLLYNRIGDFEAQLLDGVPDLAYLNPYHMVMAHRAQGYRPLVRSGSEKLSGLLLVRAAGPIRSLADLQDRRVLFPSPNAFAASLLMRSMLEQQEKIRIQVEYVGNHDNVYRRLVLGDAVAGAGVRATFELQPPELRARLRVLYETPQMLPHPLAAHPRVAPERAERLIEALLALNADAAGRELLAQVEMPQVVRADYERDYAPLARLGLERYVVGPTHPAS